MEKANVRFIYEGVADRVETAVLLPDGNVLVHDCGEYQVFSVTGKEGDTLIVNLDEGEENILQTNPSYLIEVLTRE